MKVTIDPSSGFCFGVKRAIEQAESKLKETDELFCVGDIVHNKAEVERLGMQGLTSISPEELKNLKKADVLFRAHGEPPSSYRIINGKNVSLTDATCPIVKKLQERIKKAWEEQKERRGQIVIFGNPTHPETKGLVGQTDGEAIVVTSPGDLEKVDSTRPVELFSQTTKGPAEYRRLSGNIRGNMKKHFGEEDLPLKVHNTICAQISGRTPRIRKFAGQHDIIIFVGGAESSNARVLFRHCREVNPRSRFITGPDEIESEWFTGLESAGICGATSTPHWLMEKVAKKITEITYK